MFAISLAQLINQTVQTQPLTPRCGGAETRGAAAEMCATRCSRQCNQAKCAITHRVDLTSGHFTKLKTRHLRRTRSLLSITPSAPDWLRGDLPLYKCSGEPQWEAQTSRSAFDVHGHHQLRWCSHHRRSVPAEVRRQVVFLFSANCCFISLMVQLTLSSGLLRTPAKMKVAILCLCLASTASAAPVSTPDRRLEPSLLRAKLAEAQLVFVLHSLQSFFHYLPHLSGTRPQVAPSQVRSEFSP